MKSDRKQSFFPVLGLALGAAAAIYAVRLWRQLGMLNRSLQKQRVFDDDFSSPTLGRYYYSFFPSYMQPETEPPEVDEEGIPVSDYTRKVMVRGVIGRHYNPLTVSHWVLGAYDDYLDTGDPRHYDLFIKRADWLVENQQLTESGAALWYHTAGWGRDKKPWTSAMTQGFVLSGLCRAYQETKDEKYIETARRALKGFDIPVEKGGITAVDRAGNVFFEEWAFSPAIHILNGHIFALFGLYDYYRATGDPHARELFQAGIDAIRNRLPDYDVGFWSRYSLHEKRDWRNHWTIAAPIYQQVHVDQLYFLAKITGDETLAHYADRWETQQRRWPINLLIKILFIVFKDVVWLSKQVRGLRNDLRKRL